MPTPHIHRRASRLDDGYLPTFDVTDTFVLAVDAEPETVREALERLALTDSATRGLCALGAADRLALAPARLAAPPGSDLVFGLVWRVEGSAQALAPSEFEAFDMPGHVKVTWDLGARSSAAGGSFLSNTTRFAATDEIARARLLAGWAVLGPLGKRLAKGALAAVKAYAEERDEPTARGFVATPVPIRAQGSPTRRSRLCVSRPANAIAG
jgi:hypothetical protein